ncbi:hypothetical protein ACM40_17285 [Chryseobacterium sp. BLS98]|nr:hypothetical protein ACM40_17285 [Chryseobacterium sp. BLS98]
MNNINVKHKFFIDKIEKLDFCGKEIYSLKGGRYTQPYDIIKLEYEGPPRCRTITSCGEVIINH